MRPNFLLSLPLATLLLAAGCTNAPAQAAQASADVKVTDVKPAEVKPAEVKPADVKLAAAEPAKGAESEDGCIYKDAHQDKPDDEAGCPHGAGEDGAAAGTGTPGHYGAAFALKETKPLSQILASAKDAKDGLKDPVQVGFDIIIRRAGVRFSSAIRRDN